MEVLKAFNIKLPVLFLKPTEIGGLGVIDSQTTLRLIDVKHYKILGGFKTNIEQERTLGCHVDIASSGKYSVAAIPGSNKAAVFSVAKKGLLYQVGRHQGPVESVAIDPDMRYVVTGGEDGKTFAWFLQTAKLAFTMPPHTDYVSAVAFSRNGQWLATGSFDKTVSVMNIDTMKNPLKLRAHSKPVVFIEFIPKQRLVSADKEGGLIIWDLQEGKLLERLTKMHDDITALCTSTDGRFLFVGTKLGYVALYDLSKRELLKQRYLKEPETISSLAYIEEGSRLVIGTLEGNVKIYELFGNEATLMTLITKKEYAAVYEAFEDNPVLVYSNAYTTIEKVWSNTLTKARTFVEKNDLKTAQALFSPFMGIPKKRTAVDVFLKDAMQYEVFKKHIKDKRYPLAYSMISKHPNFKETAAFKHMESTWKKNFFKAQQLILKKGGEEMAKQLLAPYRGISDKTALIQQLLNESQRYLYFKQLIVKKEFKKAFELIKVHPFLTEFNEYFALMDYGDKLYMKAQESYQNGEYPTAEQYASVLVDFPDFHDDAVEMLDAIRAHRVFFDAISTENYANAYGYLASYPLLYDTKEGIELETKWRHDVDSAMKRAYKCDIQGVTDALKKYTSIEAKFVAMATAYEQCYICQLEQAIKAKKPVAQIEKGIKKYIAIFGLDENIALFFETFKRYYETKLDLEHQRKGNIGQWKPAMVIPDILDADD